MAYLWGVAFLVYLFVLDAREERDDPYEEWARRARDRKRDLRNRSA